MMEFLSVKIQCSWFPWMIKILPLSKIKDHWALLEKLVNSVIHSRRIKDRLNEKIQWNDSRGKFPGTTLYLASNICQVCPKGFWFVLILNLISKDGSWSVFSMFLWRYFFSSELANLSFIKNQRHINVPNVHANLPHCMEKHCFCYVLWLKLNLRLNNYQQSLSGEMSQISDFWHNINFSKKDEIPVLWKYHRKDNNKQRTVACNNWLLLLSVSCRRWNAITEREWCGVNSRNKQAYTWRWSIPTWFKPQR